MAKIRGKQLDSGTISQENLGLVSPEASTDATTKEYADSLILDSISVEKITDQNQDMTALDTSLNSNTSGIGLACNTPVLEDSVLDSSVEVYINGIKASVGEGKECFFSPDGIVIRLINDTRIGDKLYWDSVVAYYNLDETDKIDFKYLTNDKLVKTVDLAPGETVNVTQDDEVISTKFDGVNGETATLNIDGTDFVIGLVADQFVFDIGGGQEYTFTEVTDFINVVVNDNSYVIRWDGIGSAYFSVVVKADPTEIYGPNILSMTNILRYKIEGDFLYTIEGEETNNETGIIMYGDNPAKVYKKNYLTNEWILSQIIVEGPDANNRVPVDISIDGNRLIIVTSNIFSGSTGQPLLKTYTRINESSQFILELNGLNELLVGEMDYRTIKPTVYIKNNHIIFHRSNTVNNFFWNGTNWIQGADIRFHDNQFENNFGYRIYFTNNDELIINSSPSVVNIASVHQWNGSAWVWAYDLSVHPEGGIWYPQEFCIIDNKLTHLSGTGQLIAYKLILDVWQPVLAVYPTLTNISTPGYYVRNFDGYGDNIILTYSKNNYNQGEYISPEIYLVTKNEILNNFDKDVISNNFDIKKLPTPGFNDTYEGSTPNTYDLTYSLITSELSNDTFIIYSNLIDNYLFEYKMVSSNDYIESRLFKPAVGNLEVSTTGRLRKGQKVSTNYDYSHLTDVEEGNSKIEWKTKVNWDPTLDWEINTKLNGSTVRIPSNIVGKRLNYNVIPTDVNNIKNIKTKCNNDIMVADNDNELFGMETTVGPILKLTIISGNILGQTAGIYYLSANDFSQRHDSKINGETVSSYYSANAYNITSSGTSAFSIYLYGGHFTSTLSSSSSSSATITMSVNSSYTSIYLNSSDLGSIKIKGVPSQLFKTYTVGGCTFTIEKSYGWKQ